MDKKFKKYNNHIIISLILIISSSCLFSQDKLQYGTTSLSGKQLQVDKYDCTISPSFSINKENPENLKLNFSVSWVDKKGNQIQQPDKISLFIKVSSNIDTYCSNNQKKLSTTPGLFSKKNIELTNSVSFIPSGIININQYDNIHFKDNMPPVPLKVMNYVNTPITMNLALYIGKEKGNSLDIEDKTGLLSWNIVLPEVKPDKKVSCDELENKYTQKFQENKPRFLMGTFEGKLFELESMEKTPVEKLWELKSNLVQYKSNISSLITLKETIKNDPNYKKCDQLPLLIGSINSLTVDVNAIQNLIKRVNASIQKNAGGSGAGGDEIPYEAFLTNGIFCENTFNNLYSIKVDPDLLNNYDPGYLNDLYTTLQKLKVTQDSLFTLIASASDSPEYKRAYKNFNVNHKGSIEIILELDPDIAKEGGDEESDSTQLLPKGRSFPYTWVIIPIVLILALFGGFKLFKYIKKLKSLDKKTK